MLCTTGRIRCLSCLTGSYTYIHRHTRIRMNTYTSYIRTRRAQGWSGLTGSSARGNTETAPHLNFLTSANFDFEYFDRSWFPNFYQRPQLHLYHTWTCTSENVFSIQTTMKQYMCGRRRVQIHGGDIWQLDFAQHWLCLTSYHPLVLLLFKDRCYSLTFLLVRILHSDWWAVRRFGASHWWRAWLLLLLLLMVVVESSRHRSRN